MKEYMSPAALVERDEKAAVNAEGSAIIAARVAPGALQRLFSTYTPEVHARNMEVLRVVYRHLTFISDKGGWTEGETQSGTTLAWHGDEHPLNAQSDLCLRLPMGLVPLIQGMRLKPADGPDDGVRGTVITTPWLIREHHLSDENNWRFMNRGEHAELSGAVDKWIWELWRTFIERH
jgi:hypothetical protein